MKNSTFKSFNVKKFLLIALIFAFGLSFSSLFVLKEKIKSDVCASEEIEQIQENPTQDVADEEKFYSVKLYGEKEEDGKLSTSGVTITDGVEYSYTNQNPSTGLDGVNIPGGSKIIFNDNYEIIIKDSAANQLFYTKLALNPGYCLDADEDAFCIYIGSSNTPSIIVKYGDLSTPAEYSMETLDPDYSGMISIRPDCEEIVYQIDFYYEDSLSTYSKITETFTVSTPIDVSDITPLAPIGKTFANWVVRGDVLSAYEDTNVDSSHIYVKHNSTQIYMEYTETVETLNGTNYVLSKVACNDTGISYGNLTQNNVNPLIIAMWETEYTANINNSGAYQNIYWKGFNSTSTNRDLFGVGLVSSSIYGDVITVGFRTNISDGIIDPYFANSEVFKTSTSREGLAFMKRGDVKSAANRQSTSLINSYYVYNYGHYVSSWKIKVEFNGRTYYVQNRDMVLGTTETSVPIADLISNGSVVRFSKLAQSLDNAISGMIGLPVITMIPNWMAAEISVLTPRITQTTTFGNTSGYNINSSEVVSTGKTLLSYQVGECLVAENACWNYKDIPYTSYRYAGGAGVNNNGSSYSISVEPVWLNNIYRVYLQNIEIDITNTYELEEGGLYNYSSALGVHEKDNAGVIKYYDLETFITWQNYACDFVEDYTAYLGALKSTYETNTSGPAGSGYELLDCVYYNTGSVSGNTLTGATSLWIYIANNMDIENLPAFYSKYYQTIAWSAGEYVLNSINYQDIYDSEFSDNKYSKTFTKSDKWSYEWYSSSEELTLSTFDLNKVHLYYNVGTTDAEYDYIEVGVYGKTIPLNFLDENGDEIGADLNWTRPGEAEKFYGGWVFDVESAQENNYKVSTNISNGVGTLTAYNANDNVVTVFDVKKIDDVFYYINNVTGTTNSTMQAFVQNDSNPILKIRWASSFDLTIENKNTYWKDFDSTKDNEDLYGVESYRDEEVGNEDHKTTTFSIADKDIFAYKFQTSVTNGTGTAFFHKSDFNDNTKIMLDTKWYYVYSYGQSIAYWTIRVDFISGASKYLTGFPNSISLADNEVTISVSLLSSITFDMISSIIDDYMLTNDIYDIPSVTMYPTWTNQTFKVVNAKNPSETLNSSITFGHTYSFDTTGSIKNAEIGKSLFAVSCDGADLIAVVNNLNNYAGVWNYQNIVSTEFVHSSSVYTLSVDGVYVDNIYKIKLINSVQVESNIYEIENSFSFIQDEDKYISILTFLDDEVIEANENVYRFTRYNDEVLIDNYISNVLRPDKLQYEEGINGFNTDFTIFGKIYTTATINSNQSAGGANVNFYIYLASNQNVIQLPEFKHDLSMLILWENENDNKAYKTAKYNESKYSAELNGQTLNNKWAYIGEASPTLKAHYVYTVRLYYKYYSAAVQDSYSSIHPGANGGYFGEFTTLPNINLAPFVPANTSDQIFEHWIFDLNQAKTDGYSLVADSGNELTISKGSDNWVFTYDEKNIANPNLFYITKITGYTRFVQKDTVPIIYAKWKTIYDTIIDASKSYWFNLDGTNTSLFGAYSKDEIDKITSEDNNFTTTTLKVADVNDDYLYAFMDSEKSGVGLSFYHYKNWKEAEEYYTMADNEGWYFVFSYGEYVSGWQIIFTHNNVDYYISNLTTTGSLTNTLTSELSYSLGAGPTTLQIQNLSNLNLANIAEIIDDLFAGSTIKATIKLIPIWEKTNINIKSAKDIDYSQRDFISSLKYASTYIAPNDQYEIEGKAIMSYYYGDNTANLIAKDGVWNYRYIDAEYYSYTQSFTGVEGSGTYSLIVYPYFVDNIYKVNLTNITTYKKDETAKTYRLENCDFTFNSKIGAYNNADEKELRFDTANIDDTYKFVYYKNQITKQPLMDDYIEDNLIVSIAQYETEIRAGTFEILRKVYYSNITSGTPSIDEANNELLVNNANSPKFHIYLANEQPTGNMPMFKKDYFALIFWANVNEDEDGEYYAYPTAEYDEETHSAELEDFVTHNTENGEFDYIWKLTDGYIADYEITLTAHYYRKNYELQIFTLSEVTNAIERRGFVIVDIDDILPIDETIKDESKEYVVIYHTDKNDPSNSGMKAFIYQGENFYEEGSLSSTWSYYNNPANAVQMRLYEGCNLTLKAMDQSKDPMSMHTGLFDDVIGYKFSGKIVNKIDNSLPTEDKQLLKDGEYIHPANDKYSYFVEAPYVANKNYKNKEILQVEVYFDRIEYDLNVAIDNTMAGELNIIANGERTEYVTAVNLTNIVVHNFYQINYYAFAGYKMENNSFIIQVTNNFGAPETLQTYHEDTATKDYFYLKQNYVVTANYNGDSYFDGTWLRTIFYKYNLGYEVENVSIGTLTLKTDVIEFSYGIKSFDETNADAAGNNYIFETISNIETIALDEFTGKYKTRKVSTYLDNSQYGFYIYNSQYSVEYALLSTRMFFPNNQTTQDDNYYKTYSFLLTNEPINCATLTSNILQFMVQTYEKGVIISPENGNRNIYIMLEVRKLLTINMKVSKLMYDSNTSVRKTTLTNADNNSVELTILPNDTYTTSMLFEANATPAFYDKTALVYTYVGLENNVYSTFDKTHYERVEYILNNDVVALNSNKFQVTENATLTIKFVPKSLQVEYKYVLNGLEVSLEEALEYINEINKPNQVATYYIGNKFNYKVECVDNDYNINVKINGENKGSTTASASDRIIDIIYEVLDADFSYGCISIEVNMNLQDNSKITINYQLSDASKRFEDDYYGTFDVFENETLKADDVESVEVSIIDGRKVSIKLDVPVGYQYESVKFARQSPMYIEPDSDGIITLISSYNHEDNSGEYIIYLKKVSITAQLDTTGTHTNSTYSIDNKKVVQGLYIGKTINFTSSPCAQERLDYFYYLTDGDVVNRLIDEASDTPLMQIKITSELLEKVNSQIITFRVAVVKKFKLEVVVDDNSLANIAENGFKLEFKDTGLLYSPVGNEAYVDENTEITISVQTIVFGKYNIDLTMNTPSNPADIGTNVTQWLDKDVINKGDVVITLNQDYIYTIVVEANQYEVIVEENLYTSLSAVFDNIPDKVVNIEEQINGIISKGQKYNQQAEISFVRKTEDRELSTMFISNNDNADNLVIEFKANSYVVYKIVDENKEVANLSDYGFQIDISQADRVVLKYTTYNNIEIRFDYKLYKVIQA